MAKKFLGVTDAELERLRAAVLAVLDADGPLDPGKLKERLGDAVRSLGEEGRKRGQSTTLPMVLGELQTAGEIRRVPVNGRLDQQRYAYVRWAGAPRIGLSVDEVRTELARRYFRWAGPASLAHFRWFSGLGVGDAKKAVAPLDLAPVDGTDLLLAPADGAAFAAFERPDEPSYALVASIDGISLLRRDAANLLDETDAARLATRAGSGVSLADLPHHAIVDRGRVVGVWEFDAEDGRIVWAAFTKSDAALRAAVERTEGFVRDELGDARSMSLDSPGSRGKRLAAVRELAG
jgi:hypothetical protein